MRAVDAATGRGLPLVYFEDTSQEKWVTDNAGRAALLVPGLDTVGMDASSLLWLSVYSPGYQYEVEPNKNGYRGVKIATRCPTGRPYNATIGVDHKTKSLGYFRTAKMAALAYAAHACAMCRAHACCSTWP